MRSGRAGLYLIHTEQIDKAAELRAFLDGLTIAINGRMEPNGG